MPSMVNNYKCPACTGPLHFASSSGKLECEYCGSTYDVEEIEKLYAENEAKAEEAFQQHEEKIKEETQVHGAADNEWDVSGLNSQWGADQEGLRVYNCPSCGAELICDDTTAATSCVYCGNPTIVPGQFVGIMKPDYIIPFKLDKQAAVDALKKHYHGKRFLPKLFTDQNHIEELQGVYVPFWLYDGTAMADVTFDATRSHMHREGNYNVTTTEHFNVRRAGTVDFDKVPVDASSKMSDDYMDSIEPYDYADLVPFSTAYLPGYLANKYDVSAEDCSDRADERCKRSALDIISSTVNGFETCSPVSEEVQMRRGKVSYALLPVWMLNTKWNGKNFLFAMNGQSGKMVGDLPVSWGRFWSMFGMIAAPVAAVLAVLMLLL